ncbi:hypothetical protein RAS1_17660 [Phycisphaerae bacterium RAS1]|nr:hypothetical protein RAS1_17660 [Phycisphaerae bacterium RAS1]
MPLKPRKPLRVIPAKGRGPKKPPRRPPPPQRPPLRISQILKWADAHRARTGRWPTVNDREVHGVPWEIWRNIHQALYKGLRGLPPGSSIARLLARHRGLRHAFNAPPLSINLILNWADDHHRRTGDWPKASSGRVLAAPAEQWHNINAIMIRGGRTLKGGLSLPQLLAKRRGVRNRRDLRPITIPLVLKWADAHHRWHGSWPHASSGPVLGEPGETWAAVQAALFLGSRRFPGGTSLASVLQEHRGVRNIGDPPRISIHEILAWADDHRRRFGRWPSENSGHVAAAPQENWSAISQALCHGRRGLSGGTTLACLLAEQRGHRHPRQTPRLTEAIILRWADEHRRRTGKWPNQLSGDVFGQPGERWGNIQAALSTGNRGLRGGSSILLLLAKERGVRHRLHPPPLKLSTILAWARAHRRRTGRWPTDHSGPVHGVPGEGWWGIGCALSRGTRGLPPGLSLGRLMAPLRKNEP